MADNWEIEITGSVISNRVDADIKYPCGEVVASWMCDSFVIAGRKVDNWMKANPYIRHIGCKSEYCG
jgi:hypothetical protein